MKVDECKTSQERWLPISDRLVSLKSNKEVSLKSDGAKEQRNIVENPAAIIGQEYLFLWSFCSLHQWVKMTEKVKIIEKNA